MRILTQILIESVHELENCISDVKQAIINSQENFDSVNLNRVDFYETIVDKLFDEISQIEKSENSNINFDIDQSLKRISELSNLIKDDIMDVVLTLKTGFDSNQNPEMWN